MIDAFDLNPNILELPARFPYMALSRLAFIRENPADWRPRMHVIPDDRGIVLEAYGGQHMQQFSVAAGSILWGYHFAALTPGSALNDFTIQVSFDDEQESLFRYPVFGSALATNGTSGVRPVLLSEPKEIRGSGSLSVKIANRADADRQCQLILCCAEPWHVMGAAA